MTSMVAQLRISLGLDSAAFDTGVRRAGASVNALGVDMTRARANFSAFEGGLLGASGAAQRTGTALVQTKDKSGQMQAGLQQLGFQLQDMTAQFSTGTKASVIFAQQGGQLVSALTLMAQATGKTTGVLGGLASFMAGPWGAAVGVAAGLAGVLIEKLYATKTAGESAASGLRTAAAAARELIGAENALKLVEKQGELNKARDRRLELELDIQKRGRLNSNGQMQFVYKQQQELQQVRWQIAQQENEIALAEAENARIMKTANSGIGTSGVSARGGGGGRANSIKEIGQAARGAKAEVDTLQAALDELEAMKKSMRDSGLFQNIAERGDVTGKIRADTGAIEVDLAKIGTGLDALYDDMRGFENKAGAVTVNVAESFKDMATNTLSALQSVTSALKGGDFLDILSSVLNLGLQLAGAGAFGSNIQNSVNKVPGRAVGGPVSANRLYMVGERGPELFMSGGNGTIIPNHRLGGGGGNTYYLQGNLLTPEFWQRITSQDVQAAQAGGELGYRKVLTKGRRRLA